ncbi:1-deoxy-D-xylulose-5-phosphate reductoisomerase [Helicobacter cetorum]|uniref:1-deoxy-D-xylulose 5-phosphate reductoisomerase n=1 Tax=Helicobacter cetorum (strain ATCC BAA-429 / MIT 00-7128) TaxID=182217 RepID=I0EP05_HELC0|nr:1-deoxy-D-xylulose-5-phosphate reductoisomerase [Helicobacter cetorum]AFI04674.1 1-deoxy-D-xylulose 5-phosphate reductoisomerase [Helicobacter cetorum MIT 00-7128]
MIILGSTGSIGKNALKIATQFDIKIEALSCGRNIALLNEQIRIFKPKKVAILDAKDLSHLEPLKAKVFVGLDGIDEMIEECSSSLVINAIVGVAGLKASFKSLQTHKRLALANKESLVSAGHLLDVSKITPIDSEHFGLWALLQNKVLKPKSLIITASGGAFRDTPLELIPTQNVENALKHPNWSMGAKITIDSASMVNKLFEILETYWLFGASLKIDALIERSSIVHALVECEDNSVISHLASADMKLPISYAINPKLACLNASIKPLDLSTLNAIKFEPIHTERYALWRYKDLLLENPKLGVVLNASNEKAIEKFLNKEIAFGGLIKIISQTLELYAKKSLKLSSLEEVLRLDAEVRKRSSEWF